MIVHLLLGGQRTISSGSFTSGLFANEISLPVMNATPFWNNGTCVPLLFQVSICHMCRPKFEYMKTFLFFTFI